ncbi:MAG TPA: T9SS type A sorting domain-containing protein [Chitinophagales bacterium]|nr:T9SS type A sorting domain-containing protein [Chitinophagales bacterium]
MNKFTTCLTLFFLVAISNSVFALTVEITATPDICNYHNGTMKAYAYFGNPYYTYSWSNGATTDSIGGISAGATFTVTVTDAMGTTATASATIVAQAHLNQAIFTYAGSFPCEGFCNGHYFTPGWWLGGVAPYSGYYGNQALVQSSISFPDGVGVSNLCWNTEPYVYVVDAHGCSVSYTDVGVFYILAPVIDNVIVTDATNGNNGSASVVSNAWPYMEGYFHFDYFDGNGYTIPFENGSEIGSLCPGNYTVQLTGSTGYWDAQQNVWYPETCSSTTAPFTVGGCAVPTNQTTSNITSTKAQLNWTTNSCALSYRVRYKISVTSTWTGKNQNSNLGHKKITGLLPNSSYVWQVRSKCGNNPAVNSSWTSSLAFSTSAKMAQEETKETTLHIFPNPASSIISLAIDDATEIRMITIQNLIGQILVEKNFSEDGNHEVEMDVSALQSGEYLLTVFTAEGKMVKMFVKE